MYEVGTFDRGFLEYHAFFASSNSKYIYAVTLGLFTYGNAGRVNPPDSYLIDVYKKILSTFWLVDKLLD